MLRYIWRVLLTASFPIAGQMAYVFTMTPEGGFETLYLIDFSTRWTLAAALVHGVSWPRPAFLRGYGVALIIGLMMALKILTLTGSQDAFAYVLGFHAANGLLLALGASVASNIFRNDPLARSAAAERRLAAHED